MLRLAGKIVLILLIVVSVALSGKSAEDSPADKTLREAANVFEEFVTSDQGIPTQIINRAKCIAVFPRATGAAFVLGRPHVRGVVICRTADQWSAPAFINISSDKFGFQVGNQSLDAIILAMSNRAVQLLLDDKLTVEENVSAAAGPVGRNVSSQTDVKSDILFYIRTRGAFAGIDLAGTKVKEDREFSRAYYGREVDNRSLLTGQVAAPYGSATAFVNTVRKATGSEPGRPGGSPENYQVIKLFYVTDRKQQNNSPPFQYSSSRSPDAEMHFGTALVSIPRDHKMGELETASLLRLEFRNDPEKHVTLLNVTQEGQADLLRDVKERVNGDPAKQVLIFIHGYNVTFEDAARRLGQITYDLAFPGAPILYSWPSKGTFLGYSADEATVAWSVPHFKAFLQSIAEQSGASVVHVIAHSMGNRVLVGALDSLAAEHKTLQPVLQQVILAAPDIDSGVFKQLASAVATTASHFTIYESSGDDALKASHKLHDYLRLGDSQPDVQVVIPYDTVDATGVDTGFFGHSYFADNRSILADIFYLIRGKTPSQRFGIERKTIGNQVYWAVKR